MREWYRAAVDHAPPTARVTLKRITAEHVEIYCALSPPPLWGEHTHIHDVVPSRLIRTYGGGGQAGGEDTKGSQIGRYLLDACQASPGVAEGTPSNGRAMD